MNTLDLVLLSLLAACALHGAWRGLFREGFSAAAILVGIAAAFEFTASGSGALEQFPALPLEVRTGIVFVAVFALAYSLVASIGFAADRLTAAALPRGLNALGGAAFAVAKGAVLAAALLLLIDLLPVFPAVSRGITESVVARPLVRLASTVLRGGGPSFGEPASRAGS
jgi:uncharacterized membrane protein required for colicin V production